MKRLQLKEGYVKEFGRKLTFDDFYNDGMINDKFREFLSAKYNKVDTYIKPFSSHDWVDHFVVMFANQDCVIGKHYNAIGLDFCREPNEADNFSYTMGSTWERHNFVTDGRRFFDGSEKELSYELVDDVIEFFKGYKIV